MDYIKSGKALAKVIEYSGEAIESLSVDERATMTNMAAEIGGFTGIVAPDRQSGGVFNRAPRNESEARRIADGRPLQRP